MDTIYKTLEEKLNYDVVCIIKDFLDILNHKDKLIYCMDQIKSINDEHTYLLWAYDNHSSSISPEPIINKFILNSNNNKIKINKNE
jgi:hypothetical protein